MNGHANDSYRVAVGLYQPQCECGTGPTQRPCQPVSRATAQQWHRQHKADVLASRRDGKESGDGEVE